MLVIRMNTIRYVRPARDPSIVNFEDFDNVTIDPFENVICFNASH